MSKIKKICGLDQYGAKPLD